MADAYGAARSNYFLVKDPEAFKAWVTAQPTLELLTQGEKFGLCTKLEDGSWPSQISEDAPVWQEEPCFEHVLAPFLADGEIGLLMECASQKGRYVNGNAVAFDNTGKTAQISLYDIYELAEVTFGKRPSPAEQ